jgi:hypothetical protein
MRVVCQRASKTASGGGTPEHRPPALVVSGLGRDAPTVIVTNEREASAKALIETYARRMTIEQRLAEIIRTFCVDALSSTVNLNVDLDVMLAVLRARHRHRPSRTPHLFTRATPGQTPAETSIPWWGGRTVRFEST